MPSGRVNEYFMSKCGDTLSLSLSLSHTHTRTLSYILRSIPDGPDALRQALFSLVLIRKKEEASFISSALGTILAERIWGGKKMRVRMKMKMKKEQENLNEKKK